MCAWSPSGPKPSPATPRPAASSRPTWTSSTPRSPHSSTSSPTAAPSCGSEEPVMDLSRRNFIVSGSVAAAAGAVSPAQAQGPVKLAQAGGGAPSPRGFDPNDPALKYELVVANGDVLDPSQKLRGKRD